MPAWLPELAHCLSWTRFADALAGCEALSKWREGEYERELMFLTLQELSFQISGFPGATYGEPFAGGLYGPSHGYCGAGAPRFNVTSSAGTCFLI